MRFRVTLAMQAILFIGVALAPGRALGLDNAWVTTYTIPALMARGVGYPVSVTMQNTGDTTWTAAAGYRLATRSPNFAGTGTLAPADRIAPGATKVFQFQVTTSAPDGSRSLVLQMYHQGVGYFGRSAGQAVLVWSGNNARLVSYAAPTTMTRGMTYEVELTFENTGEVAWTAAAGYRLVSRNTNFLESGELAPGESIAPGAQKTFRFTVTAPVTAPSTYQFAYQLLQQFLGYFGPVYVQNVVTVEGNDATFVSQSIPTTVSATVQYLILVTMRNTGTTAWTAAAGYRLGAAADNFGIASIPLPAGETVAPGTTKTFETIVTAPVQPGQYEFRWRMRQDAAGAFGQTTDRVVVNVGPPPKAAVGRWRWYR